MGRKQGTPGRSCRGIHDEEWGTAPSLPAQALSSEEEQVRAILQIRAQDDMNSSEDKP